MSKYFKAYKFLKDKAGTITGVAPDLKKTVKKLIEAIPQDRILWQQDVKDLVQEVEEQMENHDVRD